MREKKRTNKKTNEKNEGRREKTADGTMSLASLREIPVFHSLWVGSSCRSVLPQVVELDPLEFLTIHTHRRGSRTPNRGVSLFGRRFFFGLFDSLTLVSVSFLAVCVLCAFVCLCVVDKWVRVSLHFGYGCVVHHGARSLLLVRDQQWRIAPSSSGR
jgi:hypothetical protein